jgi:hypothetical protein
MRKAPSVKNVSLVLMSPLHYLSSRSDFGFEFAEIFVVENESGNRQDCYRFLVYFFLMSKSRRLPDSPSLGVVFRLRISPRMRSQNRNSLKCSVKDLCRTDLCKNLQKPSKLYSTRINLLSLAVVSLYDETTRTRFLPESINIWFVFYLFPSFTASSPAAANRR